MHRWTLRAREAKDKKLQAALRTLAGRRSQRIVALGMPGSWTLTMADAMSLSRLVLAGAFVATRGVADRLALIAAAGLTDYLDGWLARRRGASPFGALIDAGADRVFVVVVVGTLLVEGTLSIAQCLVFVARDVVTTFGVIGVRLIPSLRATRLVARPSGKIVTALQFLALVGIIVSPTSVPWLVSIVAAATVIAVADYALAVWRARIRT